MKNYILVTKDDKKTLVSADYVDHVEFNEDGLNLRVIVRSAIPGKSIDNLTREEAKIILRDRKSSQSLNVDEILEKLDTCSVICELNDGGVREITGE